MKYTTSLATLSTLLTLASAQTTHFVAVSAFQFSPNSITAAEGDKVTFVFSGTPGAHSVTQSSFAKPCEPLTGGFSSGFVSVAAGAKAPFQEYTLQVTNATQPIWFYCAQTNPQPHCILGMVGAINAPTSGNTIDVFQSAAKALPSFPAQSPSLAPTGGTGISALGAVATGTDAAATTVTAPPNSTPPAATTTGSSNGTSSGTGTSTGTGTQTSTTTKPSSAASLKSQAGGLVGLFAAAILGVAL